jgi:hypothetical protein
MTLVSVKLPAGEFLEVLSEDTHLWRPQSLVRHGIEMLIEDWGTEKSMMLRRVNDLSPLTSYSLFCTIGPDRPLTLNSQVEWEETEWISVNPTLVELLSHEGANVYVSGHF